MLKFRLQVQKKRQKSGKLKVFLGMLIIFNCLDCLDLILIQLPAVCGCSDVSPPQGSMDLFHLIAVPTHLSGPVCPL